MIQVDMVGHLWPPVSPVRGRDGFYGPSISPIGESGSGFLSVFLRTAKIQARNSRSSGANLPLLQNKGQIGLKNDFLLDNGCKQDVDRERLR
jgi:hypothetical protein